MLLFFHVVIDHLYSVLKPLPLFEAHGKINDKDILFKLSECDNITKVVIICQLLKGQQARRIPHPHTFIFYPGGPCQNSR